MIPMCSKFRLLNFGTMNQVSFLDHSMCHRWGLYLVGVVCTRLYRNESVCVPRKTEYGMHIESLHCCRLKEGGKAKASTIGRTTAYDHNRTKDYEYSLPAGLSTRPTDDKLAKPSMPCCRVQRGSQPTSTRLTHEPAALESY